MRLRVLRLLVISVAIIGLYFAYEQYEAGTAVRAQTAVEQGQLAQVLAEIAQLKAAPEKPLKPEEDALEELLARLIDDTELLGSSVRLNLSEGGVHWENVGHGVEKVALSLSSAAEADAALGYFTILWQLIEQRPVRIKSASISISTAVSFTVEVELFALAGASP